MVGNGWEIVVAAAIGAALVGTNVQCSSNDAGGVDVVVGNHYVMDEFGTFAGDLVHGDRLDLVMVDGRATVTGGHLEGDELERCDWYGGELIWHPADSIDEIGLAGRKVCEGVSF